MGLTIGGVSHDASELTRGSLSWVNVLNSDPDTLTFLLNAGTTKPTIGSEVSYTLPDGTKVFGGRVAAYPETPAAFKRMGYAVTCSDWRSDADRRILNDRFVNKKTGDIIVGLFEKYAPEFDTSQVDTAGGPTISSIRFGRNVRLSGAMERLAELTGFVWDISPDKEVIWKESSTTAAPFSLTDTSRNFKDLEVEYSRDQLANQITVRGGKYQSDEVTTDYWNGDTLKSLFRLSKVPFTNNQYVVFEDSFSSFDTSKWVETDVTNPSPPAGHISADGYLFTTIQQGSALVESGYLQVVGGNGAWGDVRLMSFDPIGRGDGARRFELDVYAENTTGQGRCGLWDPSNQSALAGEAYGLFFDAGTLKISQGGVTSGSTLAYTAGSWTRIRIVPGAVSGATIYAQTGANFQTRTWTTLGTIATGSLENFTFAAMFNKDFNGRVDRAKVFNRLLDGTLTVGGTAKTCGLYGVDEDGGVDALIRATPGEPPILVFFDDTIPASGTNNIRFDYYEGAPVLTVVPDEVSIAAIAALEGHDGIYEGYVEDPTLDSMALARARGQQELDKYANPVVTVTFRTNTVIEPNVVTVRAGQVLNVSLTDAGTGRTLSGDYLIHQVECRPLGLSAGQVAHEFVISAGSRLKGLQDYVLELLKLNKRGDEAEDPNEVIEELVFQSDDLEFTDSTTIEEGPLGPYVYGALLGTEEGGYLLLEDGGGFEVSTVTPAIYGQAVYS